MGNLLFSTERLKIRNLEDGDLNDFLQYRSNPEIAKYQGFEPFSREQGHRFISEQKNKTIGNGGEWMQFGIELTGIGQLIGDCGIHLQDSDVRIAEIGITISDLHQRKGYAKEAMTGILNFLFLEKEVHRVVETVDVENLASIRLLKSLSFRQEAHFIQNIFFKGKWGSEYQFALLRKEWKGNM